ncbi:threonine/serine exporter family protein [Blastochloris sulfoviridis]|uniref:Threonine/serine exporter family protein n=1 Tax=Blastochloris sulfoviridis TaxID=50712 RepID=A0A5M6I1T1_9HYPH|nr:threonine/serine exporter family protein [Blastochloris sulfoviridis]KAA5602156.1 threonine/serine exporter family protein [Blastochloris sulfoviridis]
MAETIDSVRVRHRDLERYANCALSIGRTLMECGTRVKVVHDGAAMVARGLGVEAVGLRSGYASLEITVGHGVNTITRMMPVGRHGVNQRLDLAVRRLAAKAAAGGMTVDQINAELAHLVASTPRHPAWFVALATGIACAAFGRLLGVDWPAVLAILLAGTAGQGVRHVLLARNMNFFVVTAIIAFLAASLGGIGARLNGSATVDMAMMASILLLVPGVPATNAQADIMDGFPTVGSARVVWVVMVMVFATTGMALAQTLLGLSLLGMTQ